MCLKPVVYFMLNVHTARISVDQIPQGLTIIGIFQGGQSLISLISQINFQKQLYLNVQPQIHNLESICAIGIQNTIMCGIKGMYEGAKHCSDAVLGCQQQQCIVVFNAGSWCVILLEKKGVLLWQDRYVALIGDKSLPRQQFVFEI